MGEPLKSETELWSEVRGTQKDLHALDVKLADIKGKVDLQQEKITTVSTSLADHRDESKAGFKRVETLFDSFSSEMKQIAIELAEKRGAGISRREMIGWGGFLVSLVGLLVVIF